MRINSYELNLSSAYNYFFKASQKSVEKENETLITTSVSEIEKLALSASGLIKTSEKNINFSINSELFREETQVSEVIAKKIQMIDPLIINLSEQLARVSEKDRFDFDMDGDGKKESVSLLANENAFLAFDKNRDGLVNDGGELFGAKSGNGFADMAEYDSTKDGVIDENDSLFDKLKLWIKTASEDRLVSLKDVRVGALILDHVNSSYKLIGEGEVNAQIQKSGVALFEDGKATWMSHIDFAVKQESASADDQSVDKNIRANAPRSARLNTAQRADQNSGIDATLERLKRELKELTSKLQKTTSEQEQRAIENQKTTINNQIATLERAKAENVSA